MDYLSSNFLLLLLLIQAILANCCIEHERDALLEFKAGVKDKSSRLASWRGEKCCNWEGIRCSNQTGHVVKLNLRNTNFNLHSYIEDLFFGRNHHSLAGKISPSLSYLSDLKHLDLSFNNFSENKFPKFIGTFRNLRYLNLSNTGLSGMIPPQLGNLSRLLYFDLNNDNTFSYMNIDTRWLSNLRSLKHMDMSGIDFKNSNDWVETLNKLSSLEVLLLSDNNLNQISNALTFVNFTSLRVLHLSDQNFNTTIPNWVGNLTSLNKLALDFNSFDGMIPPLHSLTKLTELSLPGNNIKGDIMELLLGNLSNHTLGNLELLDLDDTNLVGTLAGWIGDMTSVTYLDLGFNNLSGIIPIEIGNLTNLVHLDLNGNSLTGIFDSDWTPSFQLNHIDLSFCKLGPKFPSWLRRQVEIKDLYLGDNEIGDSIPDWLWGLSSLRFLELSNNVLRGKLPVSLVHMTKLMDMDLSNNLLEGKIPFLPTSLEYLDLSNNSLSGQLRRNLKSPYKHKPILSNNHTAEIVELFPCGLTNFGFLDLSNNNLSGNLPLCWSNISLEINIANNRLSGVVPSSSSCLTTLQLLRLENNSLTGEFPFDLQFCRGLQLLDLGENNFHGVIPDWVGESFHQLQFLRLQSNLFSGIIPSKLTQLNNLRVLDLANNYISGSLPKGLDNFTSMSRSFSLVGVDVDGGLNEVTKGLILEYDSKELSYWKSIDLSKNNLIGEIPQEIVALTALLNLNLSHNHLIGNIPLEIGNMTSLESLDLSMNNLSGTIPQSISVLYSLEVLNFSYNNLSGSIPTGHQLQTLDAPSIYSGNPYLCGPPLEKSCGTSERFSHDDGINDPNSKITGDWDKLLYMFIEFGFLVGFFVVFFILLFKVKWRYTYFQMVDSVFDKLYVMGALTFKEI